MRGGEPIEGEGVGTRGLFWHTPILIAGPSTHDALSELRGEVEGRAAGQEAEETKGDQAS